MALPQRAAHEVLDRVSLAVTQFYGITGNARQFDQLIELTEVACWG